MPAERSSAGFTLIEVLVALVIVAVSMSILMASAYGARHRIQASTERRKAIFLARTLLARASVAPYDGVTTSGEVNGFHWTLNERSVLEDPRRHWLAAELTIDVALSERTIMHAVTRQLMARPAA